ncbi:hypothetical protein E4U53_003876 [Claviceps sorghi]|nr:hypothetical protein E4U53_003876 [Claviceps sorghi]
MPTSTDGPGTLGTSAWGTLSSCTGSTTSSVSPSHQAGLGTSEKTSAAPVQRSDKEPVDSASQYRSASREVSPAQRIWTAPRDDASAETMLPARRTYLNAVAPPDIGASAGAAVEKWHRGRAFCCLAEVSCIGAV